MTAFATPEVIPAYGAPTISVAPEAEDLLSATVISGPMVWGALSRTPIDLDSIASLSISFEGNLDTTPERARPYYESSNTTWKPENIGATFDPSPDAKKIIVYVGNIAARNDGDIIGATDLTLRRALGAFVYRTGVEESVHVQNENDTHDVKLPLDVIPNVFPGIVLPTAADELAYARSEIAISSPLFVYSVFSTLCCLAMLTKFRKVASGQRLATFQLWPEISPVYLESARFVQATDATPIITTNKQ